MYMHAEDVKDECVSCGEEAHIYCAECNGSRCNTCNEQWHKHPKRRHHSTEVYVCHMFLHTIFLAIASQVQKLESAIDIVSCFEALCGVRPIKELIKKIPTVRSSEDANFIDKQCD